MLRGGGGGNVYVIQISCRDMRAKGPRHQDFEKNERWLKELKEHVRCPPGWSAWDRAEPLSFGTADRKQSLRCEDGLYFTERSNPTFVRLFGKSIPGYDANAWHLDWRPFTDPAAPVDEATMRAFADAIRDAHTQLGPEFTASPISVRLLACGRPRASRGGRKRVADEEDDSRSEEEEDDDTRSEEEADRRSYYTEPMGGIPGILRRRALKRAFIPYSPATDAKEEEYHRQNMLVANKVSADISAFAPGWQSQLASPVAGGGGLDLVIERESRHGARTFASLLRRVHGAETEDLPSFGLNEYSPEDLVPIFRRFTQRMLKRADVVTARTRFAEVYRPYCSAARFHEWIQAMETWAELMRKRVAAKYTDDGGAGVRVILFVTRPQVEAETEEEGNLLIGEKWRTWTFAGPGYTSELRLIPDAKLSELSARHLEPQARRRITELDNL